MVGVATTDTDVPGDWATPVAEGLEEQDASRADAAPSTRRPRATRAQDPKARFDEAVKGRHPSVPGHRTNPRPSKVPDSSTRAMRSVFEKDVGVVTTDLDVAKPTIEPDVPVLVQSADTDRNPARCAELHGLAQDQCPDTAALETRIDDELPDQHTFVSLFDGHVAATLAVGLDDLDPPSQPVAVEELVLLLDVPESELPFNHVPVGAMVNEANELAVETERWAPRVRHPVILSPPSHEWAAARLTSDCLGDLFRTRPTDAGPTHRQQIEASIPCHLVASLDDAGAIALALPDTSEGVRHGNRTWFVNGKVFAWERPFSNADIKRYGSDTPPDGPILAVRVLDLQEKEVLLASGVKGLFTIPHFEGFSAVLIQLRSVGKRALKRCLLDAWLAIAPPALAEEHLRGPKP
jgi:hypothetical protein